MTQFFTRHPTKVLQPKMQNVSSCENCVMNLKFKRNENKFKEQMKTVKYFIGSTRLLRVFHRQANGTSRHNLFRSTKER